MMGLPAVNHMSMLRYIILLTLLISCKSSSTLQAWEGNYVYEEEPIEANAGYSMIMVWSLDVSQQEEGLVGILEINGQQTALKIKTQLEGDADQVQVKFIQGLEGFGYDQLKTGDVLFSLQKNKAGGILTVWHKLEPRLSENYQNGRECFRKENNS